jgi:uncharacterized membrane protein
MYSILHFIRLNKKTHLVVFLLCCYCFGLLIVRAKLTQSVYLFFLIWNLLLATIPYLISSYLIQHFHTLKKIYLFLILVAWLIFLPNSFYIITDLVHLVRTTGNLFYFDLILISSFAITGFFLGLLSLIQMEKIFRNNNYNPKLIHYSIAFICYLNGIGIYIGRILRFNSWDILSNPFQLFDTLLTELLSKETVLFSAHFGMFIYLAFLFYKNSTSKSNKND